MSGFALRNMVKMLLLLLLSCDDTCRPEAPTPAAAAVRRSLPNMCWYARPCCGPNVLNLGGCTFRLSADRLSSCISADDVSALVRRGGGGGARFLPPPRPNVLSPAAACTGLFSALFERMYAALSVLACSDVGAASADSRRWRGDAGGAGCSSVTSSEL